MALLRVLALLLLLAGCTADRPVVDVLAAQPSESPRASPPADLVAAREVCVTFESAQLWELNSVYSEGDYLGEEIHPASDASDAFASMREQVREARADGRFEGLELALAWMEQVQLGDRSEVGEASNAMGLACDQLPRS